MCLLWATAPSVEEMAWCKSKLEEYKRILRLSSKSAGFLDRAVSVLTVSTSVMVRNIPKEPLQHSHPTRGMIHTDEESYQEEPTPSDENFAYLSPIPAMGADATLDQTWFEFGSPLGRFNLEDVNADGFDAAIMEQEPDYIPSTDFAGSNG